MSGGWRQGEGREDSEDGRWSEVELVERKGYPLAGESKDENNRAIK